MAVRKNHIGIRYGRWVVIADAGCDKRLKSLWECKCDCGNVRIVYGFNLNNGSSKSCGCLHREMIVKHDKSRTSEYRIWRGVLSRCNRPKDPAYLNYGGRGIKVCDRWNRFESFYEDMGDRPTNRHTLERLDTNGPYAPNNCVWATYQEQIDNRRITLKFIVLGVERTLARHCEIFGQKYTTVNARIKRGWSIEKALGLDEFPRKNDE